MLENWVASLLNCSLAPHKFGVVKSTIQLSYGNVGAVGVIASTPSVSDVLPGDGIA